MDHATTVKPFASVPGDFLTMSLLEEKEPTISLKAIVVFVSLFACATFAGMSAINGTHSTPSTAQTQALPTQAPTQSGAF